VTRVKICGCMRVADAVAAAEAGADFIGIMFVAESRRRVSPEEAALISAAAGAPMRDVEQDEPSPLHPGKFSTPEAWFTHGAEALDRLLARKRPLVVGVFADQPIDEVNEIAEEAALDLVQLSGNEPWSDCLVATRQAIKVLRQRPETTVADVMAYTQPGAALGFMLDPSSGSGTAGDLAVARGVAARMPIWLAGGLTPETVAETIGTVRPWLVDVSSGVETDGAKDPAKIAAFVRAVRGEDEFRTDRSSDLSSSGSHPMSVEQPRRSSPRMVGFPYRGGHRHHVVFSTARRLPLLGDAWAARIADTLHQSAIAHGLDVEAFCVMPTHVHALVAGDASKDSSLPKFAHSFKQRTGFAYKREAGRTLWHRSYYDHVVRPNESIKAHMAYIIMNPVVAGMVASPEAWPHAGPPNVVMALCGEDRSKDLSVRVTEISAEIDRDLVGLHE
jgi:phosphoribosylanthranilate isomerase/REP element-mobilizing transposase RayT